ncbi:MAG: sugar phosphate nucleotidyltransferase, partial [Myxococcota bacterium]
DRPGGLAHAVLCARDFLGQDSFVMYLGDNLVGSGIRDIAEEFTADPSIAVYALLKEVDDPSSFGIAEVDDAGRVIGLVEKPSQPRSNLALVGVYFFRPSIFESIAAIEPSARGELEITDAIADVIGRGATCRFKRLSSWWLDTGKKDDLLLANDTVLDDWLTPGNDGQVDDDSQISGRVRIGTGAVIERSRVRGPVVIGAGARIIDATIGPYTAIGDRVRVSESRVEHSILMEDSQIAGIARLEDSLIGRRVRVRPTGRRAGGLCLLVGDDSVIELEQ